MCTVATAIEQMCKCHVSGY